MSQWLPNGFEAPPRLDIGDYHLRPIREADVELDYAALMECQARLWDTFGPAWGWPPASMTLEQDRTDLARHEREIAERQSFNYALWDPGETELLGCVYIDPPEKHGADAEVSWWLHDRVLGTDVAASFPSIVVGWVRSDWPFQKPRFIGLDLGWGEWMELPPAP